MSLGKRVGFASSERMNENTLGETHKAEAERAVNAVMMVSRRGVKKSKNVQLVGFGTFKVASRGPAPE
jgi:nucleoid DNA-binding protein